MDVENNFDKFDGQTMENINCSEKRAQKYYVKITFGLFSIYFTFSVVYFEFYWKDMYIKKETQNEKKLIERLTFAERNILLLRKSYGFTDLD